MMPDRIGNREADGLHTGIGLEYSDCGMMGAAQGAKGPAVRKCPRCGTTIPMEANFYGQCGMKLE